MISTRTSVSKQLVLGHESSGVIKEVGKGVKDRFVGQRVAVDFDQNIGITNWLNWALLNLDLALANPDTGSV